MINMRILLSIILIAILAPSRGLGQAYTLTDFEKVEQIVQQLEGQVEDFPVSVQRLAVYKINYDPNRFSSETVSYIKNRVEAALKELTPADIISPSELAPTDKLRIVGSDSTLKIMNIKGRSMPDMSPELLTKITEKYSVSGLVELTLQRHGPEKLFISMRLMNPASRQIVWSKSFESSPVGKEDEDVGKRTNFQFGISALENKSFTEGGGTPEDIGTRSLLYSIIYIYRQSLNSDNSSYFGFSTGLNFTRSLDSPDFNTYFWQVGLNFDQAITQKNSVINGYRFMLGVDGGLWIPLGKRQGELLVLQPSLMFNLTKNIGFEVNVTSFLSDSYIRNENAPRDTFTFSKFGYGVKAYVQF